MLASISLARPQNLPGLTFEYLDVHTRASKFDLSLEFEDRAGELVGWFEYDSDLFEAGTIARMAGHFQTLLEAAAPNLTGRSPSCRCSPTARGGRSSRPGTATRLSTPSISACIDHIEAQVERTPEAMAVVFEDAESLTYRELNERADRLAHRLRDLASARRRWSGLCLERSLEMVVGLLGMLKAGGPTCRSTRNTRRSDWRSWWRIRDATVLLTQADIVDRLRRIGEAGDLPGRGPGRAERSSDEDPASEVPARQPGLRDLHLGLDRTAKGRDDHAPRDRQPAALDAGALRPGRADGAPEDAVQLRRLGLGVLLAADRPAAHAGRRSPRAVTATPPTCPISSQPSSVITTLHFVPSMLQASSRSPRAAVPLRSPGVRAAARRCPLELASASSRACLACRAAQPVRAHRGRGGRDATGAATRR